MYKRARKYTNVLLWFSQSGSRQKTEEADRIAEQGVTHSARSHGDLVTLYSHPISCIHASPPAMVERVLLSCHCKHPIVASSKPLTSAFPSDLRIPSYLPL